MPGHSVFRRLEPLLEQVSKPIQYVGGELNSTVKDWDVAGDGTVRWALMYPDAYEVGVPNQGVMILYEVLNERPDALAGIQLHAVDRDDTHPIVVEGGHAAFNPETIADFVDAAVVGDGEEAVLA